MYKVANIYKAKDCNSILKYIDIKSIELIKNKAPNILNKTIKLYSFDLESFFILLYNWDVSNKGVEDVTFFWEGDEDWYSNKEFQAWVAVANTFFFTISTFGHTNRIILLISKIKNEIVLVKTLTWKNPLYIPMPDPIDWKINVFIDNTPAYIKDIAVILLNITEFIEFLINGKDKVKI